MDASGKRQAVLNDISTNFDAVSEECGFRMTHQKEAMKLKIDALLNDDSKP
jgi:hypothetical protein